MASPWMAMCVCGSLGKKLAKDAREGGTEKLSRHGVVPKDAKGRSEQWDFVPRSTSFLGSQNWVPNFKPPMSSPKSAGLFL